MTRRPTAPKEVDRMSTNKFWQTAAQIDMAIPSTFGMPACGRAFGAGFTTGTEVRTKGHVDLASVRAYVPGTRAWRPPTS
jgi:hypothetical protein